MQSVLHSWSHRLRGRFGVKLTTVFSLGHTMQQYAAWLQVLSEANIYFRFQFLCLSHVKPVNNISLMKKASLEDHLALCQSFFCL